MRDAALLGKLFAAQGQPVTRAELARAAELAPGEMETSLASYLQAGYPISFHPHGGISLGEPPDIWCAEEILGRCPARDDFPAWDPLLLHETASTNTLVRDQARKGARAGLVVAASRQIHGRGRLGRSWDSPANGGLYVSLLLRPEWPAAQAGRLAILGSVAAADAVESLAGLRPRIKWPNDLILQGGKLGGLLIETEPRGARLDFAVIGLGLNVRQRAGDFSDEVRPLATSLFLATGQLYRRADLLVALLHAFQRRWSQPFAAARDDWEASSLTLGQQVTLTTGRGPRAGQALGLDESGALLLRNDSGEIEVVTAGDMQAISGSA